MFPASARSPRHGCIEAGGEAPTRSGQQCPCAGLQALRVKARCRPRSLGQHFVAFFPPGPGADFSTLYEGAIRCSGRSQFERERSAGESEAVRARVRRFP